jgi:hypothetical protein
MDNPVNTGLKSDSCSVVAGGFGAEAVGHSVVAAEAATADPAALPLPAALGDVQFAIVAAASAVEANPTAARSVQAEAAAAAGMPKV